MLGAEWLALVPSGDDDNWLSSYPMMCMRKQDPALPVNYNAKVLSKHHQVRTT